MHGRILLYDEDGRGLALPAGWQLSRAGGRRWLARDGVLIPLPESGPGHSACLSAAELDALREAIPGARWRRRVESSPSLPPTGEAPP